MSHLPRLLIVEDEQSIAQYLAISLEAEYRVSIAMAGREALTLCGRHPPDVLLLDLGLPDMDGKAIIAALRQTSALPIIVLSARDQESEKVAALEAGADDYVTKPVGLAELSARLRAALRRVQRNGLAEKLDFGVLQVDLQARRVVLAGAALALTPTEYTLLAALVRRAGQAVTQRDLLNEVWGKAGADNGHYLRTYIKHLREKLGDDPLLPVYIFTEPGIGYRFRDVDVNQCLG